MTQRGAPAVNKLSLIGLLLALVADWNRNHTQDRAAATSYGSSRGHIGPSFGFFKDYLS